MTLKQISLFKNRIILTGIVILLITSPLFAQDQSNLNQAPIPPRDQKRDIFVILDVSGSMNEQDRFTNVQNYLETDVVDTLIKDGDRFTLVTFGEKVEQRLTRTINSLSDRAALKQDLRNLSSNENYTDIGMAIERLADILESQEQTDDRRVVLFITDGQNVPPPGSKYHGVDISVDEHFKSLGEKISKESWFLYVIGIGSETAAQDVSGLVPGAELQTTDSDLSNIDVVDRITQLEQEEQRKREEAERLRELEEQARREAERAGMTVFQRMRETLGLSVFTMGLILVLICAAIPLILLIIILLRAFKPKEIVISDGKETIVKAIPVMGGIMLNSPAAVLSGIGGDNDMAFRIERGLFGFRIKTFNSQLMAPNSPYRQTGTHSLKGIINLANGKNINVTVR